MKDLVRVNSYLPFKSWQTDITVGANSTVLVSDQLLSRFRGYIYVKFSKQVD